MKHKYKVNGRNNRGSDIVGTPQAIKDSHIQLKMKELNLDLVTVNTSRMQLI